MVVIFLPAACATVVWHERTGWPSKCTVQAPHCAMPQPNLVPVSCSRSRMTHRSGVSGSASTVRDLPLISSVAMWPPEERDASPVRDNVRGRLSHGGPRMALQTPQPFAASRRSRGAALSGLGALRLHVEG